MDKRELAYFLAGNLGETRPRSMKEAERDNEFAIQYERPQEAPKRPRKADKRRSEVVALLSTQPRRKRRFN